MSVIIALTGKKQSGKSTVADILVRKHGFAVVSFADPMREMALAIDPLIPVPTTVGVPHSRRLSSIVRDVGWDVAKESYAEVRRVLQRLGTEAGRGVLGEDVWVDALDWRIDNPRAGEDFTRTVIPDCRFLNEADYVQNAAGSVWRIVRDGLVSTDTHASETEMGQILPDLLLRNRGEELGDLERVVADALARTEVGEWAA